MWSTEVGGHVHNNVSSRQHRATEVQKLHFRSSCQYTGCCALASWAARHTTVCLDINLSVIHACISQHSSVTCSYVAPILSNYYLINIVRMLITIGSTSIYAYIYTIASRVLCNSASLLLYYFNLKDTYRLKHNDKVHNNHLKLSTTKLIFMLCYRTQSTSEC